MKVSSSLKCSVCMVLLWSSVAGAQSLGPFAWQLQPYCNRVVLTATLQGSVIALAGYDDRCGAGPRAAVTGVAFPNPDGTFDLGLSVVPTAQTNAFSYVRYLPDISATVSPTSLSGTWQDSRTQGTFAFGAATGGSRRPQHASGFDALDFDDSPSFAGFAARGSFEAPAAITESWTIASFSVGAFDGTSLAVGGRLSGVTTETWTPSAHGTALQLLTTANGTTTLVPRMRIGADGRVAIGSHTALDALDVEGDLRLGTSGTNGCVKDKNGGAIIGTCSSDARFKRDITSYASMLDRVTSLRPVQFSWRSAEFADRGFGTAREDGLIAQEVEDVLPELVSIDADGYKAVNYSRLPLLTIQAVKELKAENDRLKEQNAALERRLAALETAILRR